MELVNSTEVDVFTTCIEYTSADIYDITKSDVYILPDTNLIFNITSMGEATNRNKEKQKVCVCAATQTLKEL